MRQPNTGMTYPATNAASVPPSGTQTMVKVMANGRCRRGTYSEASAAAFGIAPPSPSPARKRSDAEGPEAVDERGGGGEDAEDEDAADEREAAAHPIADEAGERAADHHADHAAGDNRPERAARHRPVAHHGRDGDAEQLVVDAVEDDRERRQQHEQLLPAAPVPVVEQVADIDRVGLSSCHERFIMVSGGEL